MCSSRSTHTGMPLSDHLPVITGMYRIAFIFLMSQITKCNRFFQIPLFGLPLIRQLPYIENQSNPPYPLRFPFQSDGVPCQRCRPVVGEGCSHSCTPTRDAPAHFQFLRIFPIDNFHLACSTVLLQFHLEFLSYPLCTTYYNHTPTVPLRYATLLPGLQFL